MVSWRCRTRYVILGACLRHPKRSPSSSPVYEQPNGPAGAKPTGPQESPMPPGRTSKSAAPSLPSRRSPASPRRSRCPSASSSTRRASLRPPARKPSLRRAWKRPSRSPLVDGQRATGDEEADPPIDILIRDEVASVHACHAQPPLPVALPYARQYRPLGGVGNTSGVIVNTFPQNPRNEAS